MDANRFYSIPFDARNDPAMKKLRRKHGGIVAFARYQALLGILYDEGNSLYLVDEDDRELLCDELELGDTELEQFLNSCAKFDLINCDEFCNNSMHIVNDGVEKELVYRKKKSTAGKAGGTKSAATRKAKREAKQEAENEAKVKANG